MSNAWLPPTTVQVQKITFKDLSKINNSLMWYVRCTPSEEIEIVDLMVWCVFTLVLYLEDSRLHPNLMIINLNMNTVNWPSIICVVHVYIKIGNRLIFDDKHEQVLIR